MHLSQKHAKDLEKKQNVVSKKYSKEQIFSVFEKRIAIKRRECDPVTGVIGLSTSIESMMCESEWEEVLSELEYDIDIIVSKKAIKGNLRWKPSTLRFHAEVNGLSYEKLREDLRVVAEIYPTASCRRIEKSRVKKITKDNTKEMNDILIEIVKDLIFNYRNVVSANGKEYKFGIEWATAI